MPKRFIDMMLKNIMSGFFICLGKNHAAIYAALGIVNTREDIIGGI